MAKVTFTDAPAVTDSELLSAMRRHLGGKANPDGALRAAVCAAVSLGARSHQVIRVLDKLLPAGSSTRPSVLDSRPAMLSLIRSCTQSVAVAASVTEGDVLRKKLELARRLVGHVLTPAVAEPRVVKATAQDVAAGRANQVGDSTVRISKAVSPASETSARLAVTIIGAQMLRDERGWDSAIVSLSWLSLQANLSRTAARRAVRSAVALGWLKKLTSTKSGTPRYRLTRLTAAEKETAAAYPATVSALVLGAAEDPLAQLMVCVAHPAWCYSAPWNGGRGYMSLVSSLAAVTGLGQTAAVRRRGVKALAAAFASAGHTDLIGTPVNTAVLDQVAEATHAVFIHAEHETVIRRQQEEARLAREAFLAQRAEERIIEKRVDDELLVTLLDAAGPWPKDKDQLQVWIGPAASWAGGVLPRVKPATVAVVARQIRWKLEHKGHLTAAYAAWAVDTLLAQAGAALAA